MSRTFCRENKDKKVEQQGRETEITWEGAWGGKKSVHLYQKYFRLLKLLGADEKKGQGEESWALKVFQSALYPEKMLYCMGCKCWNNRCGFHLSLNFV